MPVISVAWGGLALAVLGAFVVNYAWYSVLFARSWREQMAALRPTFDPDSASVPAAMALTLLGSVLMLFVLAQNIGAWTPASWGRTDGPGNAEIVASAAGFTWLGFVLPPMLHQVAWEGRPWKLVAINAGAVLCTLVVGALCLVYVPW